MLTGRFYFRDKNELPEPVTFYRRISWFLAIITGITVGLILAHIG